MAAIPLKSIIRYLYGLAALVLALLLFFIVQIPLKKSKEQINLRAKVEFEKIINDFGFDEYAVLPAIDKFHKKFANTDYHEELKSMLKNQGLSIDRIYETWTIRNVLKAKQMVINFYNIQNFFPEDKTLNLGKDAWGNPLWIAVNPVPPVKDISWVFSINSKGKNGEKDLDKILAEDDDLNIFIDKKEFSILTSTPKVSSFKSIRKKKLNKSNGNRSKIVTLQELLDKKGVKEKQ